MPDSVFAYVLAIVAEFARAVAATERYERLRLTARACDDADVNAARRVYVEFYADR
jgi:hypothetical protein